MVPTYVTVAHLLKAAPRNLTASIVPPSSIAYKYTVFVLFPGEHRRTSGLGHIFGHVDSSVVPPNSLYHLSSHYHPRPNCLLVQTIHSQPISRLEDDLPEPATQSCSQVTRCEQRSRLTSPSQ